MLLGRSPKYLHGLLVVVAIGIIPSSAVAQSSVRAEDVPDLVLTLEQTAGLRPHILGPVFLDGGGLVYGDVHGGELKVVDAKGRTIRTIGGSDDTLHFHHIAWIGHCAADTVLVWDIMTGMMTVLDKTGIPARQYSFPVDNSARPPLALSCSRNGAFAYQPIPSFKSHVGLDTLSLRATAPVLLSTQERRLSEVADVNGGDMVMLHGGIGPRPLGRATTLAIGRNLLYVGTADSAAVDVYDFNGYKLQTLLFTGRRRASSERHWLESVEKIVSGVRGEVQKYIRERLSELRRPTTLPSYAEIMLDPTERLWVSLYVPGDTATDLVVIGKDEHLGSTVRLPYAFDVTDIDTTRITGIRHAADGREQVIVVRYHGN